MSENLDLAKLRKQVSESKKKLDKRQKIIFRFLSVVFLVFTLVLIFSFWYLSGIGPKKIVPSNGSGDGGVSYKSTEATDSDGKKVELKAVDIRETTKDDASYNKPVTVSYEKYRICSDELVKAFDKANSEYNLAERNKITEQIKAKKSYDNDINCMIMVMTNARPESNIAPGVNYDAFIKAAERVVKLYKDGQSYSVVMREFTSIHAIEREINLMKDIKARNVK